jgi:hypothetical protein
MRLFRLWAVVLCLAAAMAACSGSGDTGSAGGWRVSAAHIRAVDPPVACPTSAPVLDTFMSTPTPNPNCSPTPAAVAATPTPQPSVGEARWQDVKVQEYRSTATQDWKPIYTTYTAPPGTGVYVPLVHATSQPMPTPYGATMSAPPPSASPVAVPSAQPIYAVPSATP